MHTIFIVFDVYNSFSINLYCQKYFVTIINKCQIKSRWAVGRLPKGGKLLINEYAGLRSEDSSQSLY